MNRRTTPLTIIAAIIFAFCLPGLAAAQSNDPWWGRSDSQRDRDYRRDRDSRRNSSDDDYPDDNGDYGRGRNNRNDRNNRNAGYDRYDSRTLRDAVRRVKDRSHSFQNDVDRNLDHSRIDGTRGEDHVNEDTREFRQAADRLERRVGDGRDLNRSTNEAQQLLAAAEHVDTMLSHFRVDSRVNADWREISQDLRLIADIYGLRYNGYDNGNYRNGNYDPRYPDNRNRRTNNDDWRRRIPGIFRP